MANRSKCRKRKRGNVWTESEIEHLLVYLQFARAEHYPRDAADNGITVYMNEESSRTIDVSQVQRKLQWLWYEYGPDDQLKKDWTQIYDLGIDCLSWCDLEQRGEIKSRADRMRQTMTPKTLRSGKTIVKRSEAGDTRHRSGTLSAEPVARTKALAKAVGLPTRKSETGNPSVDPSATRAEIKEERCSLLSLSSPSSDVFRTPCPEDRTVRTAEIAESITEPDGSSGHDTPVLRSESVPFDVYLQRIAVLEDEHEELRRRSLRTEAYYTEHLKKSDEQNKKLRLDVRHLEAIAAQAVGPEGARKIQQLLENSKKRSDLERVIETQRRCIKLDKDVTSTVDALAVQESMRTLSRNLSSLGTEDCLKSCQLQIGLEGCAALKPLLERSFGVECIPGRPFLIKEHLSHDESLHLLLQSLVSSALCEWVFEANVKALFDHKRREAYYDNSVYDRAWGILAVKDPKHARKLDFAVHEDLMSERNFQELNVARLAEQLADRMESVLLGLLQQQHAKQGSPRASVQLPDSDRATLQLVFARALDVKCRLLLSKDTFSAIMHPPGTPLDEANMTRRPGHGLQPDSRRRTPTVQAVQLPLLPEIRCFESNRGRVDYNSFSSTADALHGSGKCLTQAVVIPAMLT